MRDISWKKLLKKIGVLYTCFLVFSLGLFYFLKMYSKAKFSESALSTAMTTVSNMRDISGDPCLYSILGDPIYAERNYAKFNMYCPNGRHSNNSIDLRAVDGNSIIDLFKEVGRINGFKVSYSNKTLELGDLKDEGGIKTWSCFMNKENIIDFESPIKEATNINCFYGMNNNEIGLILNGKN